MAKAFAGQQLLLSTDVADHLTGIEIEVAAGGPSFLVDGLVRRVRDADAAMPTAGIALAKSPTHVTGSRRTIAARAGSAMLRHVGSPPGGRPRMRTSQRRTSASLPVAPIWVPVHDRQKLRSRRARPFRPWTPILLTIMKTYESAGSGQSPSHRHRKGDTADPLTVSP